VAARDEAGGPVLLGEVGDGPHGVADDRDVRSGERDQLVVGVDRLACSSGPMAMEESDEIKSAGIEHPSTTGSTFGCTGIFSKVAPWTSRLYTRSGAQPLEEVVGRDDAQVVLQLEEGLVDLVDEVRFDGVGEDGVALLGDAREVLFHVGERVHGAARRLGARWGHEPNCRDDPPGLLWAVGGSPGANWPGGRVLAQGPLAQSGSALA
jgi:hypothetical protein